MVRESQKVSLGCRENEGKYIPGRENSVGKGPEARQTLAQRTQRKPVELKQGEKGAKGRR